MAEIEPPALDVALAHAGFVRGLARALLGADPQVDDVVQETWIAAMQGGPDRPGKMRSWLGSVVRKKAAGVHRKRGMRARHAPHLPKPEGVPSTEEVVAKEEMRRRVVEGMLQVSEPSRSALLLRYYEDLPPREVAARLGVPVETARTRIKRGLAALRSDLDERAGGRQCWVPLLTELAQGAASTSGLVGGLVGLWLAIGGAVAAAAVVGVLIVMWADDDEPPSTVTAVETATVDPETPALVGHESQSSEGSSRAGPAGTAQIEGWVLDVPDSLPRRVALHFMAPLATDPGPTDWSDRPRPTERATVFERTPDRNVLTSHAGRFAFEGVGPGHYLLSIRLGEHVLATQACTVPADDARVSRSLFLGGNQTLAFRAIHADGTPYTDVITIEIHDSEKGDARIPTLLVQPDERGDAQVTGLPRATAFLGAARPGGGHARQAVELPARERVSFIVGRGGRVVSGQVLARENGRPLTGARVAVRASRDAGGHATSYSQDGHTQTGPDGRFEIQTDAKATSLGVMVTADGYARHWQRLTEADGALTIRLLPTGQIDGRVVDLAGEPVAGARVVATQLSGAGRSRPDGWSFAVTDDRGRFRLAGLVQGAVAVYVDGNGFVSPSLGQAQLGGFNPFRHDLTHAGIHDLRLVAVEAAPVRGVVRDRDGAPIAGASIRAMSGQGRYTRARSDGIFEATRRTVSALDGTFQFDDLVPGTRWKLTAEGPHVIESTSAPFEPSADLAPVEIVCARIDLRAGLTVQVLAAQDDEPIAGVSVGLIEVGENWSRTVQNGHAVTDAAGNARIPFLPDVPLRVRLNSPRIPESTRKLEVSDATRESGTLVVRLRRMLTIEGTVVYDPSDTRVEQSFVEVSALPIGSKRRPGARGENLKGSRWVLGPLEPGRYRVTAESTFPRGQGATEADAGSKGVELRVVFPVPDEQPPDQTPKEELIEYRIRVQDADGSPIDHADVGRWYGNNWHGSSLRDGLHVERWAKAPRKSVLQVYRARDRAGNRLAVGALLADMSTFSPGDVLLTLPREETIEGQVTIDGAPATRGVRIEAIALFEKDGEFRKPLASQEVVFTNDAGRFVVRGLGPYKYELVAKGGSGILPAKPIRVRAGQRALVELARAATVRIRVLSWNGDPIADTPVAVEVPGERGPDPFAEDEAPRTDSDGFVTVTGLVESTSYLLRVFIEGGAIGHLPFTATNWKPRDQTIRLKRSLTIEGRVQARNGQPLQARVHLGKVRQVYSSKEDGTFRINAVPEGSFELYAVRGEMKSDPVTVTAGAKDVLVILDRGIDFTIAINDWPWERENKASVSYRCVDEGGVRDRGNWSSGGSEKGKVAFVGRPSGRWTFLWRPLPDGRVGWLQDVRVEDGQTVGIPLVDTVATAGRVQIPEGQRFDSASVFVSYALDGKHVAVETDGTFRVEGVPPGRLRFQLHTWLGETAQRGKVVTFDWNDPDIVVPVPDPE